MKTLYESQLELKIGSFALNWNLKQESIRSLLKGEFETSIDEKTNTIHDVYHSMDGTKCMVIFNYHPDLQLSELIIHYGLALYIGGEIFHVNSSLDDILAQTSFEYDLIGEDEIYFHELNLILTNDLFMGGEGNRIGCISIKKN